MKTVYIVGIGMGNPTLEAARIIEGCDMLLGAPRMLDAFAHLNKPAFAGYKPEEVRSAIDGSEAELFGVLVSGDVGFFSGARTIAEALDGYDVRFIAGVPSVCGFCARLGIDWQDAALVSMHGRNAELVSAVRRSRLTFCLAGDLSEIGKILERAGFGGLTVHVGENLGGADERVYSAKAAELGGAEPLTVLMIVNEAFDNSARFGLPDSAFKRAEGVPMTKSEARAVIMSKLRLSPDSVCWDVGAGSGSVSAEMALGAYKGHAYAVERDGKAIELAADNCRSLHIGNISFITGSAPEALNTLPAPDAVFIGGSGGAMREIISAALSKNPKARIVASAIALETMHTALKAFEEADISDMELIQLGVSRASERGGLHLLLAQNPVFIISGGGL